MGARIDSAPAAPENPGGMSTVAEPPGPPLPEEPLAPAGPTPEEIQEPVLENLDRAVTGLITVLPPLILLLAVLQAWNNTLHWSDVALFVLLYIPTCLGITVGFHGSSPTAPSRRPRGCAACSPSAGRWRSRAP